MWQLSVMFFFNNNQSICWQCCSVMPSTESAKSPFFWPAVPVFLLRFPKSFFVIQRCRFAFSSRGIWNTAHWWFIHQFAFFFQRDEFLVCQKIAVFFLIKNWKSIIHFKKLWYFHIFCPDSTFFFFLFTQISIHVLCSLSYNAHLVCFPLDVIRHHSKWCYSTQFMHVILCWHVFMACLYYWQLEYCFTMSILTRQTHFFYS